MNKTRAKSLTTFALAVFIVSVQMVVLLPAYAHQNPIAIDGADSDWVNWVNKNGEPWVCPSGRGCSTPATPKTVWLCCNTTSMPRECQIVWRDGRRDADTNDLDALRLYMNPSYVYIYANISNPFTQGRWRLIIGLGNKNIEVRVLIVRLLFWRIARASVYVNDVDRTQHVSIGVRYTHNSLGLELRIPRGILNPLTDEEILLSAQTMRGTTTYDRSEVSDPVNPSVVYEYARLLVSGGRIIHGYFGYTDVPIPIPEPGVVLSLVALSVVAVSSAVFARGGARRRADAGVA